MRVLVLGGNAWLGREMVTTAIEAGHDVTTFTRGASGPSPDGAVALHGDRSQPGGMDALQGTWDVAIDVSRSPHQVAAAIEALEGRCARYVFVSTVSVYADFSVGPITTETRVVDPETDEPSDDYDLAKYPNFKVECEALVRIAFPDRHLIVRPGLIVGPGDPTDRLTYWVERAMRPGPILSPGEPYRRVRFSDFRDLASWYLAGAVSGISGTFNTVGPQGRLSFADLIKVCLDAAGRSNASTVWVDDDFLLDEGVQPYGELPLWVPDVPQYAAFSEVDSSPAERLGLTARPVSETIADLLAWTTRRGRGDRDAGMSPAREEALLDLWSTRT